MSSFSLFFSLSILANASFLLGLSPLSASLSMLAILLLAFLATPVLVFAVTAVDTPKISISQPIQSFDGQCLTAPTAAVNATVILAPCDGSRGQMWDITQVPRVNVATAFVLSGVRPALHSIVGRHH